MKKNKTVATVMGAILFFCCVTVINTVGVAVFVLVSKATDNTAVITAVMISVIALLSLIMTAIDLVRRKITVDKPVNDILNATDKISKGDFSVRLTTAHDYAKFNEFDYIKENLNKMAEELEKTEILHADFISDVSHEIKTPLAVIQNYAAALRGERDETVREKYAQTVVSAAKRLSSLVTNVLKLNKLENQGIIPECEKFRLDEQIAQIIIDYENRIESKGIELECDLEETEIISYPGYLETVWNNLVSNAVKFTDKGKISVRLKTENGKAVVKVSDTGTGISAETGARIFDKFYQGDRSHSEEGNGLGLALVKKIIDVIGGQISVESTVGKGSVFTVTLDIDVNK